MSTQSLPYPNPAGVPGECNANAGCGGNPCPVNGSDATAEVSEPHMRTSGEGNFKLTYYNGWKVDGVPTDFVGPVGYNWSIDAFPYVTTGENDEIVFVWAPGRGGKAVWFSESGGGYVPQFGARQTLTEDGDTWRVTDPDGTVWVFSMDDLLLSKMISPGGVETHYEITGGKIVEKWRDIGGEVESRTFAYSGDQLTTVTLYRGTSVNHFASPVRRVTFAYYTSTLTDKGSTGDLKTVTDETYDGSNWQPMGTRYYRYYTSDSSIGFVHGLRYIVGPTAYASLGGSPDSVSNGTIAGLAEKSYEYDPDTRWVTKAATHGGTIEFTLESEESPHAVTDYDDWQFKTIMTLPDGSTKTIYANSAGRDLLVDHDSTSGRWIHYNKYNAQGHLEWRVEPSAIDMSGTPYNEGVADLAVDFNANTGLIHVTTYYTSTGSGAAAGYPDLQQVKQGSSGTPISVSKTEYISRSVGSGPTLSTIYPVWKRTVYKSDASNGSDPVVTEYNYTWHTGTNQPETITTNLPDIGSGQNGGAWLTDQTRVQEFDVEGRLVSSTDARGEVTTYDYDDATDTLAQMVQDPSDLNIITDYESDGMGRTIKTMGPEFTSNSATVRTVNWTVYLDDQHEIRTGHGYKYGSSSYALVNPILITRMDPSGRVTDDIQATTLSTSSVPTGSISQSDWTRWTHHEYFAEGLLSHTDVYYLIPASGSGTEGTNFNRTRFGYDAMGRRNYVKSPAGTITRTVYDPRGLVLSTWVGTNDTGATDTNPAGSGGNNMKPVSVNLYDDDAYGTGNDSLDGLLTKVTSPVDTNSANDRVVEYRYDWRDRQVKQITTDGTHTFEAENVYDNLSRVTTAKETRLGSPNRLIAESVTYYDDWGRVYRTQQKGLNDSGTVTQTLTSNTWYDAESNVIKSFPAGSEAFTKSTYDAIGRQTASYTGYYSGSGSETPQSVATDVIFEETHTAYDDASNVIHTTTKERWHDATGNGALNGPSGSQPKSRDSYVAMLYDGIGRNVATANYGTNNDAGPPTWPTSTPSSSATLLVNETSYNEKGEDEYQTDPSGMDTRTVYDAAGRVTSTSRNHGTTPNELVQMTYNPDGQLETLTAVNSDTGNQVTTYSYGVTLTGSGIASNALLASVDYPDSGDVDYEYNRQGQRIKLTDQNGSVHEYTYDKLGRQTADKVTYVANGVDDSVLLITWSYDNRKRLHKVTSYDAVTSGSVTSDVEFAYNSFNQLVTEYQQHGAAVNTGTSPKVEYSYASGSANTIRRESCTYPDTTALAYNYGSGADSKLSRPEKLYWSGADVATYQYLGLGQVVIQKYVQPTFDVEYTLAGGSSPNPYTGLDRFGRIIDLKWKQPATTLVHLKYGYDLASNRTYRRDEVARSLSEKFDELYYYDGLHRLTVAARGELNSNNDGFTGSGVFAQTWNLDSTGNWKGFDQYVVNPFTTTRAHNTTNEITGITTTSGSPTWDTPPSYDANGNMTEMPNPLDLANNMNAIYDAWNRMISFDDGGAGLNQVNAYDGLNRRITSGPEASTVRHFYYSDQWQVLEERLDSDTTADRQYVWGLKYIDDLVLRDTPSERLYALQDALFNVVALTNTSGAVVERFAYQAYGQSEPLDPDYTTYSGTDYSWTYRFTGRELDLETGLQLNRMRYLHLQMGRWLTRDPIGYEGGSSNLYEYCGGCPTYNVDPEGARPRNSHKLKRCPSTFFLKTGVYTYHLGPKCWWGSLPNSSSMPHQHCIWNCRMSGTVSNDFAKRCSAKKESGDVLICMVGLSMSKACWDALPQKNKNFYAAHCCSANQPSDFQDNATGRACGDCNRFARDGDPNTQVVACKECCTKRGIGPNTPDGPGTNRPCGPLFTGRMIDALK